MCRPSLKGVPVKRNGTVLFPISQFFVGDDFDSVHFRHLEYKPREIGSRIHRVVAEEIVGYVSCDVPSPLRLYEFPRVEFEFPFF